MRRDELSEMRAFLEVARERSFTKAAAKLGVTRSALSHTIRSLESRLGIRLLSRTTRDVAPTTAGERLRAGIEGHFKGIEAQVASLMELRDTPTGTVRIACTDDSVDIVFRPRLSEFLKQNPEVNVELIVDNAYTNIVESRFDAGVRLGESIDRDMVAVRIGPDVAYAVVGSPAYLTSRPIPASPQDLTEHSCINYRLPTAGSVYLWEFVEGARQLNVRVNGQLTVNNAGPAAQAAVDGVGLAYVPRDLVKAELENGKLREVLLDWCPHFEGYHLYYPSRRNLSSAFTAFVDAFRYRV